MLAWIGGAVVVLILLAVLSQCGGGGGGGGGGLQPICTQDATGGFYVYDPNISDFVRDSNGNGIPC